MCLWIEWFGFKEEKYINAFTFSGKLTCLLFNCYVLDPAGFDANLLFFYIRYNTINWDQGRAPNSAILYSFLLGFILFYLYKNFKYRWKTNSSSLKISLYSVLFKPWIIYNCSLWKWVTSCRSYVTWIIHKVLSVSVQEWFSKEFTSIS